MKRLLLAFTAGLFAGGSVYAQDWAKPRVESSPRHLEWVTVKHDGREVGCYIGYPEIKTKATAIVIIHDIFGLTDWARSVVDQFAEAGYIAITPDLLWGAGAKGGGTAELAPEQIGLKIRGLAAEQVTADLAAAAAYVRKLDACNGKVVIAGFCWGGTQSFRFATNAPDLQAALVFYGSGPTEPTDIARIKCPVYGFYGGNDARVTSTVAKSAELMTAAGKTFAPQTYDGAGHGFMKSGEAPPPKAGAEPKELDAYAANKQARNAAWQRVKEILGKL